MSFEARLRFWRMSACGNDLRKSVPAPSAIFWARSKTPVAPQKSQKSVQILVRRGATKMGSDGRTSDVTSRHLVAPGAFAGDDLRMGDLADGFHDWLSRTWSDQTMIPTQHENFSSKLNLRVASPLHLALGSPCSAPIFSRLSSKAGAAEVMRLTFVGGSS